MNITCHGAWYSYKPKKGYPNAPYNTLYARRNHDKMDWYEFAFSRKYLKEDTVKATCYNRENTWVVAAATFDETELFPSNAILIEIEGYNGDDPRGEFTGRSYDPDKNKLSEEKV